MADEGAAPASVLAEHLGSILDAIDDSILFVLRHDGTVAMQNQALADRILPFADATDWLASQVFFDVDTVDPEHVDTALIPFLLGKGGAGGKRVRYITPFGQEFVTDFRSIPLGGTNQWLVMGRDRDLTEPSRPAPSLPINKALHDLGNVLGIIQIASEGLLMQDLTDAARIKAQDILAAAGRGHRLLSALLQTGSKVPEASAARFDIVLADAASIFRRVLPEGIVFSVENAGAECLVGVTQAELEAAVIEMFAGARKYLTAVQPPSGSLTVSLVPAGREAELVLSASRTAEPKTEQTPGPPADYPCARALAASARGDFETSRSAAGTLGLSLSLPARGA